MPVSEWRRETHADLSAAMELLRSASAGVAGEPTREQMRSIWLAYMKVEKSIAFIRFEFDEENPGRFVKLRQYAVPDERQALQFAQKSLRKGMDGFVLGDFVQALRDLRESRNFLRALLREKRLKRVRDLRRS